MTGPRLEAPAVSAIVVSYSDPEAARAAIASLLAQSLPPREILVVDNHAEAPLASPGAFSDTRVRVVRAGENIGYTAACNLAAAQATGEWIFFLNPDARADPLCLEELIAAAVGDTTIVGAQVLLPDGRTNAGHNPVHFTGISWAGRYGQSRESGASRAVAAVSGAALLVRAGAYRQLWGMCERFFLYYDDTDLCWRARLAGSEVRFCPRAVVWHDYDFDKGMEKWYWLERNRLWSVLANYSSLALVLLGPALLATELAVLAVALRGGWLGRLLRAWASVARSLRELRRWRSTVQESRRRRDSELLELMTGRFETELLDAPLVTWAGPMMDGYAALVRVVLRRLGA